MVHFREEEKIELLTLKLYFKLSNNMKLQRNVMTLKCNICRLNSPKSNTQVKILLKTYLNTVLK